VNIDWGAMRVTDVFPSRVPDLFVGRPVILTGRYTGTGDTTITISGSTGDRATEIEIPVQSADGSATHTGLPAVWARAKIADIAERAVYEHAYGDIDALEDAIKQVALEYGLMSAYTAFVAVDSLSHTTGNHGTTVAVPVPVPDGVKYETTVTE
jgi:Ca-activated chloride channel family protein